MHVQVLDLDGSVLAQDALMERLQPTVVRAESWGPRIRIACSLRRFRQFERSLAALEGAERTDAAALTLHGSGDFHHVSLALVRRLRGPINLLVIDKHPDWMRAIPFLHCGTWLYHAARLPQVGRVFHVGGDLDFDNHYRWLAPWPELRSGRITIFPAVRCFRRGSWAGVPSEPVRPRPDAPVTPERLDALLEPFRAELARHPLYVSVDKDVLVQRDAAVNWDSGHLHLTEVQAVLVAFLRAACGRLAGMDLVGDWSPVRVQGLARHLLHHTEHPTLQIDPAEAARRNERANLALIDAVRDARETARGEGAAA
jgi:hypothetical protein